MQITRFTLATLLSTAALSSVAYAQTIPNTARPEQAERRFKIEPRPAVSGAPVITVDDQKGAQLKGSLSFVLKKVVIKDSTAYSEEQLKSIYADKIGQKISLNELNGVAAAITAKMRNDGYILSRAILPPQNINGGVVTIRIVEGHVNNVRIEGDVGTGRNLIQQYADRIRAEKPLNSKTLERYLLLMEDLPGVQARAVLQPAAGVPGASDVIVTVTRKMVDGTVSLDNRGSKYLGRYQAGITLAGNNVIGMEERTQFRIINTAFDPSELKYGEVKHEEQIDDNGTKLILGASYVKSEPGSTLSFLDIEGRSRSASVMVSHPFERSRQSNTYGSLEFAIQNVDLKTVGSPLYEDRLRTLTGGMAHDFVDQWAAVNRLEANIVHGMGILDTSSDTGVRSRASGKPSFWKFEGKASHLHPISGPFYLSVSGAGQYSFDPLLAAEEFTLGGAEFGSAYDPAEISGDSGLAGRLELQYNESADASYLQQYQLYGYYDAGVVWNRDIVGVSEEKRLSLTSVGLGTRLNFNNAVSGNLELSRPLTREVAANNDKETRLFFGLELRY